VKSLFSSVHKADRLDQQFMKVNIDPPERYVLSPPGSAPHRLHAWEGQFSNVTLCGDWIYTGMNVGSIESAALSGALASFALTGLPQLENIQGYFFLHSEQNAAGKNVHHPLK